MTTQAEVKDLLMEFCENAIDYPHHALTEFDRDRTRSLDEDALLDLSKHMANAFATTMNTEVDNAFLSILEPLAYVMYQLGVSGLHMTRGDELSERVIEDVRLMMKQMQEERV